MSPYWVCVVLRGGVETRNRVCMKKSQTRSSQMSFFFFPLHKTEFHQFLRCIEFGEPAWLNSQHEVSFTCKSVQLLVAELFCCVSRPGTFTWFFSLRLFIIAFKIFGVGRLGASRSHLPTDVPVSWTSRFVAVFNMCLFLREEGSEMSTFCWALHFPVTEGPCQRQCRCLASAWLIALGYFNCCAATRGAWDPVFPAGPGIVPTDLFLPQKKMFKAIELFLRCSLCRSWKITSLAEVVTYAQAWRWALVVSTAWCLAKYVLLGLVRKRERKKKRKKECLFKNLSANEGVMKSPGLCTQSPFFKQLPFLFTVLSAIPKCCNSDYIFTRDQLALWVVSPLPAPSSQLLPSSICFHNNTVNYYF